MFERQTHLLYIADSWQSGKELSEVVRGQVASDHGWLVILFGPYRSKEDEIGTVSRRLEVGNYKRCTILRWALLSNGYFVHCLALCIQQNFFIPSNIGKSFQTISCKGVLCIVVQFSRVGYTLLLYRFFNLQTSAPHFDCLTAPAKTCQTYMFRILMINSNFLNLYYYWPF